MKKLMYLLVAGTVFVFTACNCGTEDATGTEEAAVETVVACGDDCQKACCLGCKATEGDAKCIVLEDGSMPCCVAKSEATCCCGDANCDGSCHADTDAAEEAHNHDDNHSHEH